MSFREFGDINESLYRWYSVATARNIYPSGPQLCEKARLIAEQLCIYNFKASNKVARRSDMMFIGLKLMESLAMCLEKLWILGRSDFLS